MRESFTAQSGSGHLGGFVVGAGEPVVVAHGGPGLGYQHLFPLVEELAQDFRVAYFQQRGLAPSATTGEFTIAEAVADASCVIEHLGWGPVWFVGHSYGGHLAFHVAEAIPHQLRGVLAVDPLGAVGDGAARAFAQEMVRRVPEDRRARVEELDAKDTDGTATPEEQEEEWNLVWPGYFADPGNLMPRPPMPLSMDAHRGLWQDLTARLPELEAGLGRISVPVGVLVGAASPMPPEQAGGATVARVPGAWLDVVEGAGHFPWWERPGCVNEALKRLVSAG